MLVGNEVVVEVPVVEVGLVGVVNAVEDVLEVVVEVPVGEVELD